MSEVPLIHRSLFFVFGLFHTMAFSPGLPRSQSSARVAALAATAQLDSVLFH